VKVSGLTPGLSTRDRPLLVDREVAGDLHREAIDLLRQNLRAILERKLMPTDMKIAALVIGRRGPSLRHRARRTQGFIPCVIVQMFDPRAMR
jgi:hypothetical protein